MSIYIGTTLISGGGQASNVVTGEGISKIVSITKAEYEALPDPKDSSILYVISDEDSGSGGGSSSSSHTYPILDTENLDDFPVLPTTASEIDALEVGTYYVPAMDMLPGITESGGCVGKAFVMTDFDGNTICIAVCRCGTYVYTDADPNFRRLITDADHGIITPFNASELAANNLTSYFVEWSHDPVTNKYSYHAILKLDVTLDRSTQIADLAGYFNLVSGLTLVNGDMSNLVVNATISGDLTLSPSTSIYLPFSNVDIDEGYEISISILAIGQDIVQQEGAVLNVSVDWMNATKLDRSDFRSNFEITVVN